MDYKTFVVDYVNYEWKESGLNKTEFAKKIGLNKDSVYKLLRGEEIPDVRILIRYFPGMRSELSPDLSNICKYNIAIDCGKQDKCFKCGWNPDVEKRRIEEYRKSKR